jgi:monoamine oxidase
MARTPLFRQLQQIRAVAVEAQKSSAPVDEIWHEREARQLDRREFLRRTALLAASLGFFPRHPLLAAVGHSQKIAIIGGGLAGLTCAYRLKQQGIFSIVYEGAERLGGRCFTLRDAFADGQTVERGGELIDTDHVHVRRLAHELELTLDDLHAHEAPHSEELYFFHGGRYSRMQATRDFQKILPRLQADFAATGGDASWNKSNAAGRALDQISIANWIRRNVPDGLDSNLGRLLKTAYTTEYGGEIAAQSALNLVYQIGETERGHFDVLGSSDERFHVRGGNDLLVSRLAAKLCDRIERPRKLIALRRLSDGRFDLVFDQGNVTADKVVLAVPFTMLRKVVDLSRAGLSPRKMTAIREIGMGTNSKLHLQFHERVWEKRGLNGEVFADSGFQNCWDTTRAQRGRAGILLNFTGGKVGAAFGRGDEASHAKKFLGEIEPAIPGLTSAWNQKSAVTCWLKNAWSRGSYSFWRVGQWTKFGGYEGEPEGNLHFCGEHTSEFQGFMNGAVESGERVAAELLADRGTVA